MTRIARFWTFRLACGLLASAGIGANSCRHPPAAEQGAGASVREADGGLQLTTVNDPAVVFQRAFLRRPLADDRIVNAERREWSDPSGGVVRWQWFLAFEPAAGTREWLAGNPFALAEVSAPVWPEDTADVPAWFPRDLTGWIIQQKSGGGLTILRSRDGRRVCARDEGFGFAGTATP